MRTCRPGAPWRCKRGTCAGWSEGAMTDLHYVCGQRLWAADDVELVLARDARVGRDVALKRLTRPPTEADRQRFTHEAEVQGRLEHRAVVPVLDVGVDDDGAPYLVMRQVGGTTLAEALALRNKGDRDAERRFPTRHLL